MPGRGVSRSPAIELLPVRDCDSHRLEIITAYHGYIDFYWTDGTGAGFLPEHVKSMRIGIIGPGRIGGNVARQATRAGHQVMLAFSRDPASLEELARDLGDGASTGSPADAVAFGDIVVVSVPWRVVPDALDQAGDLRGTIVVDTTNQFGPGPMPEDGQTAAAFNAARMTGARYVKSFNTLTSAFQEQTASRSGDDRVVQWICGDDPEAKAIVADLIEQMGYVPVDLGGIEGCQVMEAPRRPGAVYGEEYRAADADAVVAAVRAGRSIPPTPVYG
jgi:predicted dinucleotide-binding enzyme